MSVTEWWSQSSCTILPATDISLYPLFIANILQNLSILDAFMFFYSLPPSSDYPVLDLDFSYNIFN